MGNRPVLVTTEENNKLPLLIIDKKGFLGEVLSEKLREQFLVVLASSKTPKEHKNVIHIPYKRKIPIIPDNSYSHIFIIFSGESEVLEMLPSILRKANQSKSRVFFIASIYHSTEHLFRRLSNPAYRNISIILFGETFDNELTQANPVNLLIYQARKYGRVDLQNEGAGKLYPILTEDVIIGVIGLAFGDDNTAQLRYIFPRHPFTELSVARIIQKINNDVKIDFERKPKKEKAFYIPEGGVHAYKMYDLEEKLRTIDFLFSNETEVTPRKKVKLDRKTKLKITPRSGMLFIIFMVFVPVFVLIFAMLIGFFSVNMSAKVGERAKFQLAENYAATARSAFLVSEELTKNYFLFYLLGSEKNRLIENLTIAREVAETEEELFAAAHNLTRIYAGKSKEPKKDFYKSITTVRNSLLNLQKIKAEDRLPGNLKTKIQELSYMTSLVGNLVDTLPILLGFEGEKTYLVIFQNNMEIRPTGGFIGSYAILSLNQGRVGKFEIMDVYDADGKLTTHVEPPMELRRYLGSSHLFLRDSNYSVSFDSNARAASDLLEKSIGVKTDGVIALDTNFIKEMLSVLEGVEVPEYKESVTADNFYLLTQNHAERDFFPGSTQKKDFLRALSRAILNDLSLREDLPYIALMNAVGKSIKEKHLMLAVKNESIQDVLSVNEMSSSLNDTREGEGNIFLDYLGVVDSNLGQNKVNYYIKRKFLQNSVLDQSGNIRTTVEVVYANTSEKQSAYGGEYKNYVRFLIPVNALLTNISIDDQVVLTTVAITDPSVYTAEAFVPPAGLEIATSIVSEKKEIGFFVTIPPKSSKKVSVTYLITGGVNTNNSQFSYATRIYKQPGTDQDSYKLLFSYPPDFRLVDPGEGMVDLGGKVTFETSLTENRDIQINFAQK